MNESAGRIGRVSKVRRRDEILLGIKAVGISRGDEALSVGVQLSAAGWRGPAVGKGARQDLPVSRSGWTKAGSESRASGHKVIHWFMR